MRLTRPFIVALAVAGGWAAVCHGQESQDRLVRDTAPLTAEQQQATFRVPEGFAVQLFADESQLAGKPINMAFDRQGRLWVTCTREYPYAVPKERWQDAGTRANASGDSIRVLEDVDGDGRADRVTIFADDLNIPTGVLPLGSGCIAWSIPNLLHLEDTNDDGVCDRRTILFGPLGYEKDTHGMISSLRQGLDGWIYATHGFSNTSHFKANDGSTLDLTSGNVFRFRPDGSRVEPWTSGQVNPFGLCWDAKGNLYSADCHSSPIYQLMRGACYPSFGRPHDGLGFAPVMCEHAHGSTGIAGVVYLDQDVWGPGWNDRMLVGNPVTSRINQDRITFTGSTPKANELPDFLTSTDPWFRPVDLQLGPDNALYVADFYNRIIGHYEVPLNHPGRDRHRGRIWKVTKQGHEHPLRGPNLKAADTATLIRHLGDPNLSLRHLAVAELSLRLSRASSETADLRSAVTMAAVEGPSLRQAMAIRLASQHGLAVPDLGRDPLTNAHLVRTANSSFISRVPASQAEVLAIALEQVADGRPPADFAVLMAVRPFIKEDDPRLVHAWKLAARNTLRQLDTWGELAPLTLPAHAEAELRGVAASIPSTSSANWLLQRLEKQLQAGGAEVWHLEPGLLAHVARHASTGSEGRLATLIRRACAGDLDTQLHLYEGVAKGRSDAGGNPHADVEAWGDALREELRGWLSRLDETEWTREGRGRSPWGLQQRVSEDETEAAFLSSLPPGGEKLTGRLTSPAFDLPDEISFWIAGHRGFPQQAGHEFNQVRLLDAGSGEILATAMPPRQDRARRVTWRFMEQKKALQARTLPMPRVRLQLVDGDAGNAYAWLAVGRFSTGVPALPEVDEARFNLRVAAYARLARDGTDARRLDDLRNLAGRPGLFPATRVAVAEALASPHPEWNCVTPLAAAGELRHVVFKILDTPSEADATLEAAFRELPYRSVAQLSAALAAHPRQARRLLDLAPPKVFTDATVSGKLRTLGQPDVIKKLEAILAIAPPPNKELEKAIHARLTSLRTHPGNATQGRLVFQTHCATCHQIRNAGGLVGPQLDGVGARGPERLLEDILDPNRDVDPAFRLHFFKRKDGVVLGGMIRQEQEDRILFADAAGQEHTLKKEELASRDESAVSLMPMGMNEVLTGPSLNDLMAYLMENKP